MFPLLLIFGRQLRVYYAPYIMRGTRDSITSKEGLILKKLIRNVVTPSSGMWIGVLKITARTRDKGMSRNPLK